MEYMRMKPMTQDVRNGAKNHTSIHRSYAMAYKHMQHLIFVFFLGCCFFFRSFIFFRTSLKFLDLFQGKKYSKVFQEARLIRSHFLQNTVPLNAQKWSLVLRDPLHVVQAMVRSRSDADYDHCFVINISLSFC